MNILLSAEAKGMAFSEYPDRLQPLAWPVLGAAWAGVLSIGIAWLCLRSRRRAGDPFQASHRAASVLISVVCFGLVPLCLIATWVQGGSAVNTERLRSPGQYLLTGKDAVREVESWEFVTSWVIGYGTAVAGVYAATFGVWLRWYTAPRRPDTTPSATPGPAV